jgi:penicillin amidase
LTRPSIGARLLQVLNAAIVLGIVAALVLVWWYALRPLPKLSGTIAAPVSQPTTVSFDTLGVPHIHAASLDDALIAQGYVTAQDRLFQMDLLRRLDAGELAEVFGPLALDSDRESRRLRLRRIAEAAYTTLPAPDRAAMAAYARGVNAYISSHLNNLPVEFTLARYQPRPWSVIDSLMICLHMFRDLTSTWRDELIKRDMMKDGDPKLVQELFPVRSGAEVQPGSNAWVLAGRRTASGKPLLSNDMHLEYSIPGIWYMTHLQAPGLDVSGVALPGTPGIIVGHNRRIAWGITNLQFDVQDLYIEDLDDRTGRYTYKGATEQARFEREIIRVKGQPSTEIAYWVTRHGPLFVSEAGDRMSLRWTAAEPGLLQFPVLDIDRAENWHDFTAALSRFPGPGSNFVYADVDGNIGYHAAGKLPVRHGYLGDLPVSGSSGEDEWDGFIPFDQLPQAFNPPSGMIVTANQNPFPPDYPYAVNGNFAAPFRLLQIRNLLAASKGWQAAGLIAVQKDVYSGFDHFLAGQLAAAYERRNAHVGSLDEVIGLLRGWNGQMDQNLAAPFVTTLAFQHIRTALVERASPGHALAYDFSMSRAVMERLLRERPANWFRDYDEMLLRALVDAVEEGKRMQGGDISKWKYGRWLRVRIDHPVIHQVPTIGTYFDIGPVPMSGSSSSPKQTTQRLAPSMRMNADLGDWDRSLLNITIGQSGQIFSSHYRDEWEHYYYALSYPMQFGKVSAKSTVEFQPEP